MKTKFMNLAIEVAKRGIQCGQSPFGSVIVRGTEVLAITHNQVWATSDPTAHAEITCIRLCCQQNNLIDLSGCTLYSTCEPCPMCFSACHWSKLDLVIFGARIEDAAHAGFSELSISNAQLISLGKSPLKIESGFMINECKKLFDEWKSFPLARSY